MDYEQYDENPYDAPIYFNNAGLVILAPFIQTLFERAGITEDRNFVSDEKRSRGVLLLHYAATGSSKFETPELCLPKILSGFSISREIDYNAKPDEHNLKLVISLLESVIQQWRPLGNTSVQGLRESFIQREGRSASEEDKYILKVEKKAIDVLLDQLPWSISLIKLPWMSKPLYVNWR